MRFPVVADTRHASTAATAFFDSYFTAKSRHDLNGWMGHFDAEQLFYADATLGWTFATPLALRGVLEQYIPRWGDGISYSTRVIGDEHSACVFVVDTPQLFGGEIRAIAAVDIADGRIVRFVDYWDGRHFGPAANDMRTPDEQFPDVLGEDVVTETAADAVRNAARSLAAALADGDATKATELFTDDAVLEDMTLHVQVLGRLGVGRFLQRTVGRLPWTSAVQVAHVVGSDAGGGYEWRAPSVQVRNGMVALELDGAGRISRLTTVWDGSRYDDGQMSALLLLGLDNGPDV